MSLLWVRRTIFLSRRILLAVCFIVSAGTVRAGEFRLCFLDSKPALDDTGIQLLRAGFPQVTVDEFKALVGFHNRSGHRVDVSRFPTPRDGFYHFAGVDDLTNRLSTFLGRTPADNTIEQNTLVCFDVSGLMLRAVGCGAPLLYENFAIKPFVEVSPKRVLTPINFESFQQATGLLYPQNGFTYLVGRPRSDAETQLGLALRVSRRLRSPRTDSEADLRAIYSEHVKHLKADGFRFPTNCELGMVFYVDVKRGFIKADHSFICLKQGGGLVTVEKTSSTGPYVRAEFGSTDDLALYTSIGERGDTNNPMDIDYGSSVVVSLNERVIAVFRPTKLKAPPSAK